MVHGRYAGNEIPRATVFPVKHVRCSKQVQKRIQHSITRGAKRAGRRVHSKPIGPPRQDCISISHSIHGTFSLHLVLCRGLQKYYSSHSSNPQPIKKEKRKKNRCSEYCEYVVATMYTSCAQVSPTSIRLRIASGTPRAGSSAPRLHLLANDKTKFVCKIRNASEENMSRASVVQRIDVCFWRRYLPSVGLLNKSVHMAVV